MHAKTTEIENLLLGLIEDQQNWRPPTIELPPRAVRITQWFRMGDHPAVLQDYESGPMGDVDINSFFIPAAMSYSGSYLSVVSGCFIVELDDGEFTVVQNPGKPFPT